MDGKQAKEALRAIGGVIRDNKDYLTELDAAIGDSDHGINMARGFDAVEKKLEVMDTKDVGAMLKNVGMTLVSTVGGSAGPLYGSLFMKMGQAAAGQAEITAALFLCMLQAGIEAVKQRGRSTVEEKTMLDALCPAWEAMQRAHQAGKSAAEMLTAGAQAAEAGVAHTKEIVATKGRASYLGERSLGHQDPGATSSALMLKTLAACV